MQIGVTFPQTEIGTDPIAIRDYAQAVQELGYSHIMTYEHIATLRRYKKALTP